MGLDLAVVFGRGKDARHPRAVVEPAQPFFYAGVTDQQVGVEHGREDLLHVGQVAAAVVAHVDDHALDVGRFEDHPLVVPEHLFHRPPGIFLKHTLESESRETQIYDTVDLIRYGSHIVAVALDLIPSLHELLDSPGLPVGLDTCRNDIPDDRVMEIIARADIEITG